MRSSALSRLVEGVWKKPHDQRPSTQLFPDLDVNRIAADLQLEQLGRERGARDEPDTGSTGLDEVEARIVERVESAKKLAHATVEDELRVYSERLSNLDFEARFSSIRQAAPACISDYQAEVQQGRGELFITREGLAIAEREIDEFRAKNKLRRAARIPSRNGEFLKWALLFALFLFEAIANGSFLAKGSEQGLIGGFFEAITFAFLNIVVAYALARFGLRQLVHRSIFREFLGLVALAIYVGWAVGLNLVLAHYREVSGSFVEGAGQLVVARIRENPWALTDLNSWILFTIGLVFSIIACLDGFYSTDPYPGFAAVQKRVDVKRVAYLNAVSELIQRLQDIKAEYVDQIEELSRDLGLRREAHDSIVYGRHRLIRLFEEHQNHLERAGGTLMSIYRDANRSARSAKSVPKRFSKPMKLETVAIVSDAIGEWNAEELRSRIISVQELLHEQSTAIHREFEDAIKQYKGLEDLMPVAEVFDVKARA